MNNEFKCERCGKVYHLSTGSVYRKLKENTPYLCKECMKEHKSEKSKSYYNNLTEEEKELNTTKRKQAWLDKPEEEKQKQLNRLHNDQQNWWNNLLEDEKINHMKPARDGHKIYLENTSHEELSAKAKGGEGFIKYWNNLSDEERAFHLKRMHDGQRVYLDNMTSEEHKKISERMRKNNLKRWEHMSQEEKDSVIRSLKKGLKEYYDNLSEEDRYRRAKTMSENIKSYWNNLSEEERKELTQINSERIRSYWNNINRDQKEMLIVKTSIEKNNSSSYTDTELSFSNILNSNNINYQYQYLSKIKHSEFDKLFPYNPFSDSDFILPYHSWDFILYLRDKEVLVDIDGSIHDKNRTNGIVTGSKNNKYNLSEFIQFKDSQRPYQTDGMEAYVVKAYSDKIEDDTIVQNVKTNEEIKFKDFLNTLLFDNLTEKEAKAMLKGMI